jgi:hypothetical protein
LIVAPRLYARDHVIPLSEAGTSIQDCVRQAPEARKPVGYDRKFLDSYRPNGTAITWRPSANLESLSVPPPAMPPFVSQLASPIRSAFAIGIAAWRRAWQAT